MKGALGAGDHGLFAVSPRAENEPGQQHDDKPNRNQRGENNGALRPRSECVDEWWNLVRVRRVAEEAVIRAEPSVDRYHERDVGGADREGAPEIRPAGAIAEYHDVVNRA